MSAKVLPEAEEPSAAAAPGEGMQAATRAEHLHHHTPAELIEAFCKKYKSHIDRAHDHVEAIVDHIEHCGEMTLNAEDKASFTAWLKSGGIQKLPIFDRLALKFAVDDANHKLQAACDIRQEALEEVAKYTEKVAVYFDDAWETPDMYIDMNKWHQQDGLDVKLATKRLGRIDWVEKDLQETRHQMTFSWDGLQVYMNEHEAWMVENGYSIENWWRRLRKGEELKAIGGHGRMHIPGTVITEERNEIKGEDGRVLLDTFKKTKRFQMPEKEVIQLKMSKMSQVYYLPKALTNFAFHTPYLHGNNFSEDLEEEVRSAFRKIPGNDFEDFSGGDKAKLYIEGPVFIMVRYAALNFQGAFVELMGHIFGSQFTAGPLKTVEKIFHNVKLDIKHRHHRLWKAMSAGSHTALRSQKVFNERVLAIKNPEERVALSTLSYQINDIVRGSVSCDGADEIIKALTLLKSNPMFGDVKFEIKKIENGHHHDASHHAFRDVRVIGALHTVVSSRPSQMLVEIRLIDRVFLAVKKFQHRPYHIGRGDFGVLPVPVVVHHGHDHEFNLREEILEGAVADGVTSVGAGAFRGCHSLLEMDFPDDLVALGSCSFEDCRSLVEVRLNDGLESLGDACFKDCRALQKVTFPDSLKSLGKCCFLHCHSLEEVELGSGLNSIGEGAFKDCRSLRKVTFPSSLKRLESQCFMDCRALESITLPATVEVLETEVFKNCRNLKEATLNAPIEAIGEGAFTMCVSLRGITLPDQLRSIEKMAFSYCKELESIALPNSLRRIDKLAFSFCRKLMSVTIPVTVAFVERAAFRDCCCDNFPQAVRDRWRLRGLAPSRGEAEEEKKG